MLSQDPARHARRASPWRRRGRLALVCVTVLSLSGLSVAAIAVWQTLGRMSPGIHLAHPEATGSATPQGPEALAGSIDILLVGTDTRTGQGSEFADADNQDSSSGSGNNDVTMVLHVTADHSNATVISIPRDTVLPVPECPSPEPGASPAETIDATDSAMFNTTLARGGLPCTVLTVEKLTGLTIPFAAIIDFEGVKAMSEAVGGVTVCVATPIDDSDTGLHLGAGEQTLLGESALQFVRTRHGVGDGSDLGRISDQQIFLSALMRKMTSAGVLANPIALYSLANAVTSHLDLSDTLQDPARLVSIALAVRDVSLNQMAFVRYPVVADPENRNRVVPDPDSAADFNEALRSDQPIRPTPTPAPTASDDPMALEVTAAPSASPTATIPATDETRTAAPEPDNVTGQTADQAECAVGN
ncbi:LytR family transcriptional regulator [Subtercola sp. Z020]|uniref:LCP family protein n=1 Tax=Subtercola sp. Z020 TaxID=2080582 RepID=UPI000CE89B9C|nr:LCP family protein [Subtercola sp. Z020]PPF75421.1 LytR family transcriptional regulator [Subtercola sp. Z020]